MRQNRAAELLGLRCGGDLEEMETSADNRRIPLWLIVRAAKLYDVSFDYLYGASDDWEAGIRRPLHLWMVEELHQSRAEMMRQYIGLQVRIDTLQEIIPELLKTAADTGEALRAFRESTPEFDDMPAGSRLVYSIERMGSLATDADHSLARFISELRHTEPTATSSTTTTKEFHHEPE